MLEDEILHVLSHDEELSRAIIVDNEESEGIREKIGERVPDVKVEFVSEEGIPHLPSSPDLQVLLWMKDLGLHESPERLKEDIRATLERLDRACDVVLLFYGLCGNAFRDLNALCEGLHTPLTILVDSRGEVVDDCIAAVVGGRVQYKEMVEKYKGVYFMTPMWASTWREMAEKTRVVPDGYNYDLMRLVFRTSGYDKVIKIDTGLGDQEDYERRVEAFSKIFEMERKRMDGDLDPIYRSYRNAKDLLRSEAGS